MSHILQSEPLLLLGVLAVLAFYMGLGARKVRLPSLIGFMVIGAIMGPSGMNFLAPETVDNFSFLTELALGFVAFAIGAELSLRELREQGGGIISIIFAESFAAFGVVTLVLYLVTRSWPAALLFGALAPASAPAGTVAVIQECRAKGKLTKALYAVVGFDDGLAILIFGFAAAVAKVLLFANLGVEGASQSVWGAMGRPMLEVTASLGVGLALGFLFCRLIRTLNSPRDMLVMTFGFVLIGTGISEHFHLSLILTNMVIGFVLVNTQRASLVRKALGPLHEIMPLMFLFFFALAGAHLDLAQLPYLGVVGVSYIAARTIGLMGGARLGGMLGRVDEKVKKYVGMGILSQAGVAIGLSLIIHHDIGEIVESPMIKNAVLNFAAQHPDASKMVYDPSYIAGALVMTITATCIVFEIVGPILTKIALVKAGEIPEEPDGNGRRAIEQSE